MCEPQPGDSRATTPNLPDCPSVGVDASGQFGVDPLSQAGSDVTHLRGNGDPANGLLTTQYMPNRFVQQAKAGYDLYRTDKDGNRIEERW